MTALDTKALLTGVTPGPWAIDYPSIYAPSKGLRAGRVAAVSIAYKDTATYEANARLIASAPRLARRVIALEEALRPFAELAGGDVNMNDPLRKWITVGQLWEARAALKGEGDE